MSLSSHLHRNIEGRLQPLLIHQHEVFFWSIDGVQFQAHLKTHANTLQTEFSGYGSFWCSDHRLVLVWDPPLSSLCQAFQFYIQDIQSYQLQFHQAHFWDACPSFTLCTLSTTHFPPGSTHTRGGDTDSNSTTSTTTHRQADRQTDRQPETATANNHNPIHTRAYEWQLRLELPSDADHHDLARILQALLSFESPSQTSPNPTTNTTHPLAPVPQHRQQSILGSQNSYPDLDILHIYPQHQHQHNQHQHRHQDQAHSSWAAPFSSLDQHQYSVDTHWLALHRVAIWDPKQPENIVLCEKLS